MKFSTLLVDLATLVFFKALQFINLFGLICHDKSDSFNQLLQFPHLLDLCELNVFSFFGAELNSLFIIFLLGFKLFLDIDQIFFMFLY
jgi:hypothetical protein